MSEGSDEPRFDRTPVPSGVCEQVSPLVRRLIAGNAGPFTFTGTCTYIVGWGRVAVIDPGPAEPGHLAALLAALGTDVVTHIMVTHTHRDHSPGARALKQATGAPILGCGPHRAARSLSPAEGNPLEASADPDHAPDREMGEGDVVEGPDWRLEALATPGHTANHLAFILPEERALFSGDHVMAWSTSIVAPPDGAMGAYRASLARLEHRDDAVFWPGHGPPVREPRSFVRGLLRHRRAREAAILDRLRLGDRTIAAMVGAIYPGLPPALHGGAALSIFAHLEDLMARGIVLADGAPVLAGSYRLAEPSLRPPG